MKKRTNKINLASSGMEIVFWIRRQRRRMVEKKAETQARRRRMGEELFFSLSQLFSVNLFFSKEMKKPRVSFLLGNGRWHWWPNVPEVLPVDNMKL